MDPQGVSLYFFGFPPLLFDLCFAPLLVLACSIDSSPCLPVFPRKVLPGRLASPSLSTEYPSAGFPGIREFLFATCLFSTFLLRRYSFRIWTPRLPFLSTERNKAPWFAIVGLISASRFLHFPQIERSAPMPSPDLSNSRDVGALFLILVRKDVRLWHHTTASHLFFLNCLFLRLPGRVIRTLLTSL